LIGAALVSGGSHVVMVSHLGAVVRLIIETATTEAEGDATKSGDQP